MIDVIINYEIAEFVKFFGSIVGTEGVSDEVKDVCNGQLLKLTKSLEGNVEKAIQANSAQNIGLIK